MIYFTGVKGDRKKNFLAITRPVFMNIGRRHIFTYCTYSTCQIQDLTIFGYSIGVKGHLKKTILGFLPITKLLSHISANVYEIWHKDDDDW